MQLLFNRLKNRVVRIIILIFLSLFFFFTFDRGAYILFKKISTQFYNKPIKNSINEIIDDEAKNFFNTLILGSSRTKQGIHPWYINKYLGLHAYKNAGAGQYLKYNYYYYKIFKKKYKIPDYLIYGFDYFIFNLRTSRIKMNLLSGKKIKRKNDLKIDTSSSLLNIINNPSLLLQNKEKINTFMIDVLDRLSGKNRELNKKNLITNFKGQKRSVPKKMLEEPLKWEKKPYTKYPGSEGKYLDLLFDELKDDNVKIFIVILPDFINVYKTNYERELFFRETKLIFKKYENVTILNYYTPNKFDITNSDMFRDGAFGKISSHLSFYGAKELNKLLCLDMKKIINSEKNQIPEK